MRSILVLCGMVSLICSCNYNHTYETYKALPDHGWHKDSIQQFVIPQQDSLKKYNLYFSIRNNNDYPFSNLWLISTIAHPNGKQEIDTLQYQMALPNGEWLGTGGISIKENKLWFKKNYSFSEPGSFKISIAQAMRKNGSADGVLYLQGITDVGIQVESVETIE